MPNRNKEKGTRFENEATKVLNTLIEGAKFKRVPSSGALGTILKESLLRGDITGEVEYFPKKFKIECKSGYNDSLTEKQFALKKQWLDKIREEAQTDYSFPVFMAKYDNVRDNGVKHVVVLDVRDFAELINTISHLQKELDELYHER